MYERTYRGKSPERVIEDLARCEGDEVLPEDLQIVEASRSRPTGGDQEISSVRPSSAPSAPLARTKEDLSQRHTEALRLYRRKQ